jgi:flagellar P-ring protein precursor FlgI
MVQGTQVAARARRDDEGSDLLWLVAAAVVVLALTLAASGAHGVKIADITRVKGQEENTLLGWGLVVGLKGTGDGKTLATVRPFAMLMQNLGNHIPSPAELKNLKNVALVMVSAKVGPNGGREGDKLDCHVSAAVSASSLRGGRLIYTPLVTPIPGPAKVSDPIAIAQGSVEIERTDDVETEGVIGYGAQLTVDVPAPFLKDGSFTLVLDDSHADFGMSAAVAKVINEYLPPGSGPIAEALDAKNVRVRVPESEAARVVDFIGEVRTLPVLLPNQQAVVVINERTGDITITGDVEIGPVVITHGAMTISTVTPKPQPTPQTPVVEQSDWVAIDTQKKGAAKLSDLTAALNELKVPAKDKIAIIVNLHKSGKLYAKLQYE